MDFTLPSKSDICMPDSDSNRAGNWAAILVISPVILCMPAVPDIACRDDGDLVDIGQRRSESADHFGQAGDEFIDHGGLVPFLIGFRFHVHRLCFGFTFAENDIGVGFTLHARGGGRAFGFNAQLFTGGCCQHFVCVGVRLRRLLKQ